MKKIATVLLIIATISLSLTATTHSQNLRLDNFILESKVLNSEKLSKKLVRFHVIANSDAEVDQFVKLEVKDAVLEDMVPKLNSSKSKEETITILNENSENIKHIAEKTLRQYHASNKVSVVLDTVFFPTKYYKDFSLPAGDYLALRVVIGKGEGKNWWCVLFPPLCLVDVKTEEDPESDESVEEQTIENEKEEEQQLLEEAPVSQEQSLEEDPTEKENKDVSEERPRIRWKALEWLGFYKD